MRIKLITLKTHELSKSAINAICKLKNTHWRYNLNLQKIFFYKNSKKFDIHNLLYNNNKLIGYTMLRRRKIVENYNYYLFDTLIIQKKFRGSKLGKKLMEFNNLTIKKSKRFSILFCNKKLIPFYTKHFWKLFKFKNLKNNKFVMSFNYRHSKDFKITKAIINKIKF